jgi:hypothetical protein
MNVEEYIPDIFNPHQTLVLRSSNYGHRFRNLSEYDFSSEEKVWLCDEVIEKHNLLKKFLPDSFKFNTSSISRLYCIPQTTLSSWVRKYRSGQQLYSSISKRPRQLDNESIDKIKSSCEQAVIAKKPYKMSEISQLIVEGKSNTAHKSSRTLSYSILKDPSSSYIRTFVAENDIGMKKGQVLTEARRKACEDPRMSYSWYLCCEAFSSNLPAEKKWNADASTFEIKQNESGGMFLTLKTEARHSRLQVANTESSLPIYIKYMAMANACGNSSPLVLIVAVDDMPEESFEVKEILSMCITTNLNDIGYLLFCKSRAGTKTLWFWYYKYIVIPTISAANTFYNNVNMDNTPMRNFFSTDGEAIILKQAFSPEIQQDFASNLIDYVKGGASTTGIHNALDRTTCFRDVRREVTKLSTDFCSDKESPMAKQINKCMQDIEDLYKIKLSSMYKNKIIFGCDVITFAIQNGAISKKKLANGFRICGQHVAMNQNASEDEHQTTISFEKIMAQCYQHISRDDMNLMKQETPHFLTILRTTGQITEKDFDHKNIPKLCEEDYDIRDEFVLWRQRAVLITNVETVARFINYEHLRQQATDKEVIKAKLTVAKFTKQQATKARQEAKRVQRINMTDEEKAAQREINANKRAEKARAKQIDELKLREDAENSQRMLESRGVY